jgi:endonuclease/exonuclease/phosphatase family metal-dependent hydrolase
MRSDRFPGRRASILALAVCTLILAACDHDRITGLRSEGPSANLGRGTDVLTVMTHNIYVGADVDPIVAATDPTQIPFLAAQAYQELLSTNFPERAEAIADEIALQRPHLIGLQEVSTIRAQSPGDLIQGGTTPATDPLYDYLAILMDALDARGLDYRVAGLVQNADLEVPVYTGGDPFDPGNYDDIRLTDFDVVLARGDVAISDVVARNYAQGLPVPGVGVIPRGFVAVDATVRNRTYRFASTHLEPADPGVQAAQAAELVAALANESKPVILVGDLNTPAPDGAIYRFLLDHGFVDAWDRNLQRGAGSGLTNPQDSDLRNTQPHLTKRIDFVLVRNNAGARGNSVLGGVWATVWGDDLSERTASGLWPSDHAAVIAEMRLPALGGGAYGD